MKSVSTVISGLYAMTATGSSSLRWAMNARAAAMAASIGSPAMLFDASIRRIAPLDFEPLSTDEAGDQPTVLRDVEPAAASSRSGVR